MRPRSLVAPNATQKARPENLVVAATAIAEASPFPRHRTKTPRECPGGADALAKVANPRSDSDRGRASRGRQDADLSVDRAAGCRDAREGLYPQGYRRPLSVSMITRPRRRCGGSGNGERICGYVPRPRPAMIALAPWRGCRSTRSSGVSRSLRSISRSAPGSVPRSRLSELPDCGRGGSHGQDGCQDASLACDRGASLTRGVRAALFLGRLVCGHDSQTCTTRFRICSAGVRLSGVLVGRSACAAARRAGCGLPGGRVA